MLYCDNCGNDVLREQKDGNGKWDCLSCHKKDVHLSMAPKGKHIKDGHLFKNGRLIGRTNQSRSTYDAEYNTPVEIKLHSSYERGFSISLLGFDTMDEYLKETVRAGRDTCNDMGKSDAQMFVNVG